MSDFSWAPYGSSPDDELPPLPPLPPPEDPASASIPAPPPPPYEQLASEPPPPPPAPMMDAESLIADLKATLQSHQQVDLGADLVPAGLPFDIQQEVPLPPVVGLAPSPPADQTHVPITLPGGIAPDKRGRPQVRGGGDAVAAFVWGILGLTLCPFLIPSIIAVRLGARAKSAGGGLGGTNVGLANWGIGLGWFGIAIYALVIVVAIGSV